MTSSYRSPFPSGSSIWKRPASSSLRTPPPSSGGGGSIRPDVDPPPRPRPVLQALSFAFVLTFAALQLLPATHFRYPADPSRSWIPFVSNPNATTVISFLKLTITKDPLKEQLTNVLKQDVEIERFNVVAWIDCLDLRVLAVLANSTLSSSRLSEHVYFRFFVPESEDVKLSYYKLKVLFPDSNLDLFGQNEVKEKLRPAAREWESLTLSINELTPFIIPRINPALRKFAFVSSDTIIKGSVDELFGFDLGPYAIAAAEDCSKRLGDYVNIDILNAIERTAAKTWIPKKPFEKDACVPDLNLLLVDAVKLEKDFLESILWWNHVLNFKHERNNEENIVIAVALYNKYYKLPDAWQLTDSKTPSSEAKFLRYDGPTMSCFKQRNHDGRSSFGNIWQHYIPPKSDVILTK